MKNDIIEEYELLFDERVNEIKKGVIPKQIVYLEDPLIRDWHDNYIWFSDLMPREYFNKILSRKSNRSHKRKRCFDKQKQLVQFAKENHLDMVFGTCTLNNENLNKNYDSTRKNLTRWLKKHFMMILKNNDYGDLHGRLHFHFIACLKPNENLIKINRKSKRGFEMYELEFKDYNLGYEPNLEIIDLSDNKKISNYMVKLNNHSNKKTARRDRLSMIKNY